jgi:hypothetical protein
MREQLPSWSATEKKPNKSSVDDYDVGIYDDDTDVINIAGNDSSSGDDDDIRRILDESIPNYRGGYSQQVTDSLCQSVASYV